MALIDMLETRVNVQLNITLHIFDVNVNVNLTLNLFLKRRAVFQTKVPSIWYLHVRKEAVPPSLRRPGTVTVVGVDSWGFTRLTPQVKYIVYLHGCTMCLHYTIYSKKLKLV
jgi:hypothetical protein